MSALLPEGCRSLADIPWNLADAILTGLGIAGWDELEERDRPPRKLWFSSQGLKDHWQFIKRRREMEMGAGGQKRIDGDDVIENDAAKDLIVGE